jgi:hypothetical protein
LDFVWNTVDAKKTIKNSTNIQINNDYHLAYKLEHDTIASLKSFNGLFALKNPHGEFFLKSDILKQIISTGCSHHHGANAHHSYEVAYDLKNATKGIRGLPLTLAFGGEYKVSDHATFKTKIEGKADWHHSFSWIHQFDKNLKFVWTDNINLTKLVTDPAHSNYNYGLMFQWNL